jgi:hypothetical protein
MSLTRLHDIDLRRNGVLAAGEFHLAVDGMH